jgi:hypothetical protein
VPLGPQRQRAEAAQREEAVLRPRNGAHRVLQEAEPAGQVVARRHDDAKDRVAVAGEVLRDGVEDDVRAERERPLERRRGERVVHDDDGRFPAGTDVRVGGAGHHRDVRHLQERVGRRLEPDQPGSLVEGGGQDAGPTGGEVHVPRDDAALPGDLLEEPVRAAVHIIPDDDLLARLGQLGQRRGRRRTGRERDPERAALQVGDRALQPLAGRVLGARVLVATPRPAHPELRIRRGLVDRRADSPRQRIRLAARMDRPRREGITRLLGRHAVSPPVAGDGPGTPARPAS